MDAILNRDAGADAAVSAEALREQGRAVRLTQKGREAIAERGEPAGPTSYAELTDAVRRDLERTFKDGMALNAEVEEVERTVQQRIVVPAPTMQELVMRGTRDTSRSMQVWGPPANGFKPRITLGQTPDRCYNVVEILQQGPDNKLIRASLVLDETGWLALRRVLAGTIDEEAGIEPPDPLMGGPTDGRTIQTEYARLRGMVDKQAEMISALQRELGQTRAAVQQAVRLRESQTTQAAQVPQGNGARRPVRTLTQELGLDQAVAASRGEPAAPEPVGAPVSGPSRAYDFEG